MRVDNARLETAVYERAGVPVVSLLGEVDLHSAPHVGSAVDKAVGSGPRDLIIDLTNVSYMDSSGFGVLLGVAKRLRPNGRRVNLVGCNEAIRRMLRITRLDTVFGLFSSLEEAVASLEPERTSSQ